MTYDDYRDEWDFYSIKDFQNDPDWNPSLGEKLTKTHFRNGHWHAECDSSTGDCMVHYDKDDPYESVSSLVNHMADSSLGSKVLIVTAIGLLDQIFTGGQLRKSFFG